MDENGIIEIGRIENYWSWEYDSSTIVAILLFDINNDVLSLSLSKIHEKSGIGKGVVTNFLGIHEVGNMTKPEKGKINSILKEHKQINPFRRNGWGNDENGNMTLSELFIDSYQGNDAKARLLKIHELKKRITA